MNTLKCDLCDAPLRGMSDSVPLAKLIACKDRAACDQRRKDARELAYREMNDLVDRKDAKP